VIEVTFGGFFGIGFEEGFGLEIS
jgi:hypothetical protein